MAVIPIAVCEFFFTLSTEGYCFLPFPIVEEKKRRNSKGEEDEHSSSPSQWIKGIKLLSHYLSVVQQKIKILLPLQEIGRKYHLIFAKCERIGRKR